MLHGGRVADDALERRYLWLATLASTDQDGSYQVSSSTGHGNCSSTVSEAGRITQENDNLPLSRRLSFRKPTSRCGKVVISNCEVLYHGSLELPYLVVAAHKTDDDCLLFSPLHAIHRADLELRTMYRAQEGSEK